MKIKLTNEEKEAIELYKNGEYKVINQLLVSDSNSDIALLRDDIENGSVKILYDRETLIRDLKAIKVIYELLQKIKIKRNKTDEWAFIRGTNLIEVERFKKETYIDKSLDSTKNRDLAENKYALSWNEPAVMYIRGSKDISYIDFDEIEDFSVEYSQDILISPFTRVRNISDNGDLKIANRNIKTYNVFLEKQELQGMPKEDKQNLYINILGNSDYINIKLNEAIRLERENQSIYENIRKLEGLSAKTEQELERKKEHENYSEYEIKLDEENLERLKREVISLQNQVKSIYDKIKECTEYITNWKKSVTIYVMSECYDIDVKYENLTAAEIWPEENETENYSEESGSVQNETQEQSNQNTIIFKPNIEETIEKAEEKLNEEYIKTAEEIKEEALEEANEDMAEDISDTGDFQENEIDENNDESNIETAEGLTDSYDIETEDEAKEDNEESEEFVEDSVDEDTDEEVDSSEEDFEEVDEIQSNQQEENSSITEKPKEIVEKMNEIESLSKENDSTINRVLENIAYLLYKQQSFAKIAGNIGGRYSALNNCFEMRKQAEDLKALNKEVLEKAEHIYNFNDEDGLTKLTKIQEVNLQVSTLLNYLNNPKSSVGRTRINRFEEMAIIEENELKRNIADLLQDIRGEAELKKLKDDLEIIEDKNPLQKLLGIFTGRNKLDEVMVEQIIIRQEAIRRTMAKTLRLDYNYSIHELVAETEMFIRENGDDDLVEDDVRRLKIIKEELKQNFIILEEKIKDIINEREGRNLPIDEKVTREELIEIETFRFLKKYGYDKKEDHSPEVKYQDTTANEIFTIIDYIRTSKIL